MKVLLDTSVIYPAITEDHAHHDVCFALINQLRTENEIVVLNTHVLAELFSTMTSHPKLKIKPDLARDILVQYAEIFVDVSLTMGDYRSALDRCAKLGLVSGAIYDALHFQAAIKADVDILYTYNLRDFTHLMTDEVKFEVRSPK